MLRHRFVGRFSAEPRGITALSEPQSQYDGEVSPRIPLVAFALSAIAPGMGWFYLGRVGVGLSMNLIAVALWATFVVGLAALRFHPALPGVAFAVGFLLLNLFSALDAFRTARTIGPTYVLRDANFPLIYLAAFVFSYVLPLAGLAVLAQSAVVQTHAVSDTSAWPTLVSGDHVLLDVNTLATNGPRTSALVAYRAPDGSGIRVGRVVALPGDSVVIANGLPYVNDTPLVQGEISEVGRNELLSVLGDPLEGLTIQLESDGRYSYPIAMPQVVLWGEPEGWSVGAEQVFVLNDNRVDINDSRRFGPVDLKDLIGIVSFVSFNDSEQPVAWSAPLPEFARHVLASLSFEDADTWNERRAMRRVPTGRVR